MAEFTISALKAQARHPGRLAFFENPEDLGAIRHGYLLGHRPASMWQLPSCEELQRQPGVRSIAFHQMDFGTPYPKPTRFLLLNVPEDMNRDFFHHGWPSFDDQGYYTGPLPQREAPTTLQRTSLGFGTTGSEQWPSALCNWVATAISEAWLSRACTPPQGDTSWADNEQRENETKEERSTYPTNAPESDRLVGGIGPCRVCRVPGKTREYNDGAGLVSSGRWDIEQRIWEESPFWKTLREESLKLVIQHAGSEMELDRTCFYMAAKGEEGCDLVRNEALKDQLRKLWVRLLVAQGYEDDDMCHVAPGQPFLLRLFRNLLAAARDPDRDFLRLGERGFPVGVINPLPRTPHMFEEQTKWRLGDDPLMKEEVWRSNYASAADHGEFMKAHFEEEVREGLMEKMTLAEAQACYGDKLAISSLAVLVEEGHGGKRRIIHDASHGVKINHRIRCRDKLRSPGAREKQYLLAHYSGRQAPLFSLVGDISKAHRRFLHAPEERGLLACRVRDDSHEIYINKVGTFGVASASYWWTRISGAGLRLVHELLGRKHSGELLLYADDLEALGAGVDGRRGLVMTYLYLATLGFPFKWAKQRGGLKVEWIGLCTDYVNMTLGLSPSRSSWVQTWTLGVSERGRITAKEMEQGLGRLGFTASALLWERPFLGPLYTWNAAVRGKTGLLRVPTMLRAILRFIGERIGDGGDFHKPGPTQCSTTPDLKFFTDAKATDSGAWVGGYLVKSDGRPGSWFAEEINGAWADWLLIKKDRKRLIASLELLGSLIALKLWLPRARTDSKGICQIYGGTDNQGNSYALSRCMTTKYPLTLLVMEMSETLRQRRCELHLEWIRRDRNQLADDLTNGQFQHFDAEKRVRWDGASCRWTVLQRFLEYARSYHQELVMEKSSAASRKPEPRTKKTKLERW